MYQSKKLGMNETLSITDITAKSGGGGRMMINSFRTEIL